MSVQAKYQSALDLGYNNGGQFSSIVEENGVLKVSAVVNTPYDKNIIWDKIKEIGGANPTDIIADFQPKTSDYFAKYTVEKGDTLGKISKHFYGEAGKYKQIFEANRNILDNADLIEVGQELVIPFEQ
jgi:nucleoid-associated protein YgaU